MSVDRKETPRRASLPWRARASYAPAKSRRTRQQQYRQQMTALVAVVGVLAIAALAFVVANWRNGGSAKDVSCAAYPEYCLPLAGGSTSAPALEAPESRTLDAESSAAQGVVRYVDANNIATLGDPAAPVHFVVVSDYACPHCQDYHDTETPRILDELVRTGKATFGIVMVTGTGRSFSELASQGALCAGEQGAFWEFSDELFRLARSTNIDQAFSVGQLRSTAEDMGLDGGQFTQCLTSNRYAQFLNGYRVFSSDNGITGTPSVLMSLGSTNQWRQVQRDYAALASIAEGAAAQ